ncbi:MAG: glycoside hydrolase [Eubacteriales bacterium]|nr:glycoside hydrolase [Eubacteriales bacterium]
MSKSYHGKYAKRDEKQMRAEYLPRHISDSRTDANRMLAKKDRIKVVKYFIQLIFLSFLIYIVVRQVFFAPHYKTYGQSSSDIVASENNVSAPAFVAISYFGVQKFGDDSPTLISQERLDEQLAALKLNGYETISQQDILNYYAYSGSLPNRALFLLFEDGRRDTAVFSQSLLEKYNYLATANTYADKFEEKDGKFLNARDLRTMLRSTFWELGTNGYRLSYINVFDRYGNYYGHLNSTEFISINQYLDRDYNHYLMDFLRNEDRIREESVDDMKLRIQTDYELMQKNYIDNIGYLPQLYTLMHSNTGAFGTDPLVSDENRNYITSMFSMNFNREGSCMNSLASSVYDLTRMQPQAYWYPNHLLMRIKDDTQQDMTFVRGDETEAANWTVDQGAAEFRDNVIALTSESNSYGRIALKNVRYADVNLSVTLDGNVAGNQGILLRADRSMNNGVYVGIENNFLEVREYNNGNIQDLYSLDLYDFDGGSEKSVAQDEHEGLMALQNAILQYDESYPRMQNAQYELDQLEQQTPADITNGSEPYVPEIDLTDRASRKLDITLTGTNLTILVDGRVAVENLTLSSVRRGSIALESSALVQEKYSQRNLADDVYDAVFTDLTLRNPSNPEDIYYAYRLNGGEELWNTVKSAFETLATFFADHF